VLQAEIFTDMSLLGSVCIAPLR